jgi:acyl carrier protein
MVLFSSITAELPEIGQADYVAANSFLSAFARRASQAGTPVLSIAWDAWRESGMAVDTEVPAEIAAWRRRSLAEGLTDAEGIEAFSRLLAGGLPEVIVSTLSFAERRAEHARPVSLADALAEALVEAAGIPGGAATYPRPALATTYVPPQTDLERSVIEVWQEILGVEPVGMHDNFFELGGNSLAGLRLVQRLRERLGAVLSEVSLYESPTAATLTRAIAAHRPQAENTEAAAPAASPASVEHEGRQRAERRKARFLDRKGGGG